ncbi:hypothetical protein LK09_15475 [Microbacterium mangrovi]|uniref:STAS/SEC14 domain-containing protein n=1 Tax=Microbacterium mangrovi TaxID=1348253 RepID=A0A0B2A0B7_9MICO|nr:STAS/SEC14 domain-containing protein [Microbacterium mangrovi]KHK96441.1 hypothetical protein LK09_15475 [Microbacterium mangrovi]
MIEALSDLPSGTVGFRAHGVVTADDYRDVVEPALAAAHASAPAVNLVFIIGEDVERFSLGAMIQDAEVGAAPLSDWGRLAVVTDKHWIEGALNLFAGLFHGKVRVFPVSQEAAAIAWATQNPAD